MMTLAAVGQFVEKGFGVTVIGPSPFHFYSGMGPGMLGKTYSPDDIRFRTKHVVEKQGGVFIHAKATGVDPGKKVVFIDNGGPVPYDVVSFNAGSQVPSVPVHGEVPTYSVKPIEKLLQAQKRLLTMTRDRRIAVVIVGGGPSSAEVAGNVWQLIHDAGQTLPAITIYAAKRFMHRFPEKVRKKVARSLSGRGIRILEEAAVERIEKGGLFLEGGRKEPADFVFLATGVRPSPIFAASGLPTGPDGGLRVNRYLQCTAQPDMFGGGDCIYFQDQPLDKVGVYAVRQNPVLLHNLMAALEQTPLQAFDPGGDYLLIFNLGGGKGVLRKRWIQFGGRPAFMVKDYIDRKFMRKFQAIE